MNDRPVVYARRPSDPLLAWAEDCADVLASVREMWRELAGVLPPGVRRRAFALPALAVSAVFLAGAWWLHARGPRRPSGLIV